MEQLISIQTNTKGGCDDGAIDIEDFVQNKLRPFLHKFKHQLSTFDDPSIALQEFTLSKIRNAYDALEKFDSDIRPMLDEAIAASIQSAQQHRHTMVDTFVQTLEQAMHDLNEKFREIEALSDGYLEKKMEDTIDATMQQIEEVDGRISAAFERAFQVRQRVGDKITEVAGLASDRMDSVKKIVADEARRLLLYDELPIEWRNNAHILTGYRFLPTPSACWHSLTYVHNETGNIYTHLLGFFFFLGLGIYELFYSTSLASVPNFDRIVFAIFFIAACKCLMCSTVWHTLSGINDYDIFKRMACLDYVGISVLISASVVLLEYYGFYCNDVWRNSYIAGTTILSVIGVYMPFSEWFNQNEFKWLRIAFFIALAASGVLPILHLVAIHGTSHTLNWLSPLLYSMGSYLLGVFVYGNQLPEAVWPGKFDHIGHSHQFWHLFVCGGIWFHYVAALGFVREREVFGLCSL
ncbi:hemolysin-III related-domain-containing protein [Umbelopsis sp. AD052]|nr:hemolysin-III related-domain-containing protein [Umbelopsis sp. AD052]